MIRENTERETVSEETVTVTEYIEYQRNQSETVDSSKWYHKVISKESNTKPDMEETRVPGGNKPLTEFK